MVFILINIVLLVVLLSAVFLGVKLRMTQQYKRSSLTGVPDEIKLSPFSKALAELVAIAGGIYISLLMLTAFLSLTIPDKVQLTEYLQFDPLAFLAIVLTLIQPIVVKIFNI